MYRLPFNLVVYFITLVLICIFVLWCPIVSTILAAVMYIFWTAKYCMEDNNFTIRSYDQILLAIRACRGYMSWYFAIYASVFVINLVLQKDPSKMFDLGISGLAPWAIYSPFLISSVGILYIPVHLAEGKDKSGMPSPALRAAFGLVLVCQQMSTFLLTSIVGLIIFDKIS